jgi:hypothetical protein
MQMRARLNSKSVALHGMRAVTQLELSGLDCESQNNLILNYLKAGNTLTPLEALHKFGCFRLGARIWDLRIAGHDIASKIIEVNGKRVARYQLSDEKRSVGEAQPMV